MGRRPGAPVPAPVRCLPDVRLASDLSPGAAAVQVREGRWLRLGRGVYLPRSPAGGRPDPRQLTLARIAGVARHSRAPVVFSHVSAAALWGLTLWTEPDRVHLFHPSRAGGRSDPAVVRHSGRLDDDDVRDVAGVRVTSLERTLVDCAALLPPGPGLVVADSALAAGAEPDSVARRVAAARRTRYAVRLRAVVQHADPGAESAYESASRFVVLRDGLPAPATQVEVRTRLGTVWSDWGWPELGLLAEYDGRSKYGDGDLEAFMAEKRRHDAVVETGHRVLRIVKEDLAAGRLTERVLAALPAGCWGPLRPRVELRSA